MNALLVIDMQNDFFDNESLQSMRAGLVERINTLVHNVKSEGWPVIWVRQEFSADLSDAFLVMRKQGISKTIENTSGSELLDELDVRSTDHEVVKKRYSAFYQTDLDELLESLGIERLIIAGINTHACVQMTAIDGYQRDYEVVVVSDCVASYDTEHHDVTLKYLARSIARVMTLPEILDNV